jgi:hypothetical protein
MQRPVVPIQVVPVFLLAQVLASMPVVQILHTMVLHYQMTSLRFRLMIVSFRTLTIEK